jgi:hypothetical protein
LEKIKSGDILLPDEQKEINEILRSLKDFFRNNNKEE